MAETRKALTREDESLYIPDKNYYKVLNTPEQGRVEGACDMLAELEERERDFWSEYEVRVNGALAEASEKEVGRAGLTGPGYSPEFRTALEASEVTLLTAEQVAQRLGVHPKTIYLKARTGDIPCRRIGDAVRFVWSEVDEALRAEAERNVERRREDRGQG
jgi:excisionase family DNA binding protein